MCWKIFPAGPTSGNGSREDTRSYITGFPRVIGVKKGAKQRATPNRAAPSGRRPPYVGFELDARRAVRVRTVEALQSGRTPLRLIAVAEDAAGITEEFARQAMRADPPPPSACQEGCDWCCHLTVGTSAPEVVRIV